MQLRKKSEDQEGNQKQQGINNTVYPAMLGDLAFRIQSDNAEYAFSTIYLDRCGMGLSCLRT